MRAYPWVSRRAPGIQLHMELKTNNKHQTEENIMNIIATILNFITMNLATVLPVIGMSFFGSAVSALSKITIGVGAALGAWGGVNLMEGYGNDNPGANAHVR